MRRSPGRTSTTSPRSFFPISRHGAPIRAGPTGRNARERDRNTRVNFWKGVLKMPGEPYEIGKQFEAGVVILSLDTEQIWGYLDQMNETQFLKRYPDALGAQEKVLACLSNAGVRATWFMVGGMALRGSVGARDFRMAGLPKEWTVRIPC